MPVGLTWEWFGIYRGVGLDMIGYSCNVCWMYCAMDATMKIGWGGGCWVDVPATWQSDLGISKCFNRFLCTAWGFKTSRLLLQKQWLTWPSKTKTKQAHTENHPVGKYVHVYVHVRSCTVVICTLYTYTYVLSLLARPTVFWTHPPKVCPCAACNLNDNIFWSLEICN